jgi:beta-glucuronidase
VSSNIGWRSLSRDVVVVACALLAVAALGPARRASAAITYVPTPPTKGALYRDGQTDRYLLGGAWLSRPDPTDTGVAGGWWRNVASSVGWSPVTVPNAYNAGDLSKASMTGSIGWYRRDFTLPASAFASYVPQRFRSWLIRFESVNYRATVWLNGRELGAHAGAYLPFEYALNGVHAGVNRLVVRVDDHRLATDLPRGPGGGWWNYGGILQEVYLRSVQRADIKLVQIRPLLRCPTCAATVDEQALVTNNTAAPQAVSLHGSYGSARVDFGAQTIAPHSAWTARGQVTISHPHLWSLDDPHLYRARLTLSDSQGRPLAGYFSYSGVRSITVAGDGRLRLNGRLLDLRGFAIHEQTLATGAALDPLQLQQIITWARAAGARVLRAHYPLDPQILEMADRDGILIWSEIPVYQTAPRYLGRPGWLRGAYSELTQNILANQNHPSVMLWSIANELRTPPDRAQARYIAGAAALARRLDPTRPVGIAIADFPGVACQSAYAPLDVIGFNDYFGWFQADGGQIDDRDGLGPFLDSFRACYPNKALFVTEFGVDANRVGPVEERGTYAFQANTDAFDLSVFASKPWLSGATYFTLQDFAARPGWAGGNPLGNPPFVQKGLVDLQGNLKPAFPLVASIYKSTVQIAP